MELIFNPCGEFRWRPEGPISQIHSLHLQVGAPVIFSDLLRSVEMLKLSNLFIPSKTACLVPELLMEDVPLVRIAALVPESAVNDPSLGTKLWLLYILRRRFIGISGSLIWSKTLMELIFNPCGEFRLSSEGPVSQIHSPHHHDIFRSFKVYSDAKERVGCIKQREATAPIHPWWNCSLGSWVCNGRPAFGQNCSLGAWVAMNDLPLGQNTDDYIYEVRHFSD